MGLRALIGIAALAFGFAFVGCSKDPQKIVPDSRGKRGERCQARNDCESGLACLNNTCSKNEFAIDVVPKQCDRIECETTRDCCGDKLLEAPAACKGRDVICSQPNLPGCVASTCTSADTCGGAPCLGTCLGTGQTNSLCETAADCPKVENTCSVQGVDSVGFCSATNAQCNDDLPCVALTATCSSKNCRCQNPEYDPTDPICSDADCEDICLLRCDEDTQLCRQDTSCEIDSDCVGGAQRWCDDGRCVQCMEDEDCDEDRDESCVSGVCKKPCEVNEECPLFYECGSGGECEYVGCNSDRECILAANRGGEGEQPGLGSDDPRLYKCLASDVETGVKVCKIPCENDGSCGQFQVCDAGFCKFVGCENDEECRAYLGITNQMTTEARPFVPKAVCRE